MKDKKRLKKILRRILWVFVGIFLVILIFHTPPVRNIVKGLLSRTAANRIGGTIDVGRIQYNLLRGEVALEDIELVSSGLAVQAHRVEASFFAGDGISLRAEHPKVIIRPKPDATKSKSDSPSRFWTILKKFDSVRVEEGYFEWGENSSDSKKIQGSLSLERQSSSDESKNLIWSLDSTLLCSFVDDRQIPLDISAVVGIEQENLLIEEIQVATTHSSVDARGVLYQSGPFQGNLEGYLQVTDNLADSFGLDLPVEGTVGGKFQFNIDGSELNCRAELESPSLMILDSVQWDARTQVNFDGRVIQVDSLILNGYSGSLESQGKVDLKHKDVNAQIHAQNLDPHSLLSVWTKMPVQIASRIGGDIQLSLKEWQIDLIKGDLGIQAESSGKTGLPLSGDVNFELKKELLRIQSENFRVFESQISFAGKIKPDDLAVDYNLDFTLSDLPLLYKSLNRSFPKLPAEGSMRVTGKVGGNPQNVSVTAHVESKHMRINSTDFDLSAEVAFDQKNLQIKEAEIASGKGIMQIRGLIPLGQPSEKWDLSANLTSLSLHDFTEKFGLDLSVGGTVRIHGPAKKLMWDTDLRSPFKSLEEPSRSGQLSLKAKGIGDTIECEELKIDLGKGTLIAKGRYQGDTKNITGQVSGFGFRVEDIQPFVKAFKGLEGNIGLDADFQGSLPSPDARLVLNFDHLAQKGTPVPDVSLSLKTDGRLVQLEGFSETKFLSGSCQLEGDFPLRMTVDLSALPSNALLSAFPDVSQIGISSALGKVEMMVPLRNLKAMRYSAEVESIEGTYAQRQWNIASFAVDGDLEAIHVARFQLKENEESIEIDGTIPLKTEGAIDLKVIGNMGLDLLSEFIPRIQLGGKAQAQVQIKGTRKQPKILGEATISQSWGRWRSLSWENLESRISGDEDELRLHSFSMDFLNGTVEMSGHIEWKGTGITSGISFSFDQLDMGILLFGRELETIPSIRASGGGELSATELALASVIASGRITSIEASRGELEVSLANPVDWRIERGYFTHSSARIFGEGIDLNPTLEFHGDRTPLEWNAKVRGNVDPSLGAFFMDASNLRFADSTNVNLEMKSQNGKLSGRISTDGGHITIIDPPLSVSAIKTQMSIQNDILDVTEITGHVGSGQVKISGELQRDEKEPLPKANLSISADKVPYLISAGIYSDFSGDLELQGNPRNYTLKGDIVIHRLLIQREFDTESQSLDYLERELKSLEEERSFTDRITLDLHADVQELLIKNSLADLSASGAIHVTGTPSLPSLNGSIRTLSGGMFNLGRAQVRIVEGGLSFEGFPDNPPDVSLSGLTSVRGISMELNLRGQTDNLQTQLTAPSRTDLTQGDLVLLIMTGRTASEVGSSAGAIVAEELAADLGDLLEERTGDTVYIDVSPDPSYFSSDSDPTTRFSLGAQVAKNLFVIYSTALNGEQQRGIVNFEPDQPFWLRYIIEEDGRNIIEVNHRLQINLRSKEKRGQVESEDKKRIKSLFFQGESPLTDKELQKLSRLKPGKEFDYWKALQGSERIQKELIKLGYRGAQVEFEEKPLESDQVEAIYSLKPGKRIKIDWKGDSLGGGFKKDIEAFWDAYTPEVELVDILARQTEYALMADRFYQAEVSPSFTTTDEAVSVELEVQKGPKGEKVIIQFFGNDSLPDAVLSETLPDPETSDFFAMIDKKSRLIRRRIHLLYASHGFIKGRVKSFQTDFLKDRGEFLLNITIEEGPQALIASVTLPADVTEIAGPDTLQFDLIQDQPFQLEDYMNDRSALRDFYNEQGFFRPRVSGMLKPVEDKIAVSFVASKGPRARVGKIRKGRPGRTRLSRIESTLSLKEGDLILPREIARNRQRFIDTQAYRSVDIRLVESEEGPHIRDIVVDLIDKPEIELNYGVRYTLPTSGTEEIRSSEEYSAFEVGGRLEFLNPFGYGRRLGVSGYIFGREQFVRLFMEQESFFGYRIPTQVYLSHTWKPELLVSGIQSRTNQITFQQYKRWQRESEDTYWADKLRLKWNYSFRHIQITPIHTSLIYGPSQSAELADTYRGSISLALLGDSRDSFVDPTRGFFWGISSEFARKWLGSDVNYNKLYLQTYFYLPLTEDIVWASGLRVGAIPGENPFLIIEDRFRTGGPYSVRGFPVYYLGPKNAQGEPLGGQAVFIFNQELRFPIYKMLHGGIFYDAGNVFALASQMSLSEMRHCAGAGFRLVLPFGPIRLDWAYVLDPLPEEKRYQIYFSIGHAF